MKTPYTKLQILLEAIGALLLISTLLIFLFSWKTLPAEIPTHYNLAGEIDAWGTKNSVLFIPLTSLFIYIGISIVTFFPKIWNMPFKVKPQNAKKLYQCEKTMLIATKIEVVALFSALLIATIKTQELSPWFLILTLGILFGTSIFFIIRMFYLNKED
ncbi:MAG: DUF1648 domain-containing protein [Clostridiales bacterium]